METGEGGLRLPSYRGEIVNGAEFSAAARVPDPERMLSAYHYAAGTTNLVRALGSGGFGDLARVREWGMDWACSTRKGRAYMKTADRLVDFTSLSVVFTPTSQSNSSWRNVIFALVRTCIV
jgi:3-deoxy-7-phosphoheptulonate synthase